MRPFGLGAYLICLQEIVEFALGELFGDQRRQLAVGGRAQTASGRGPGFSEDWRGLSERLSEFARTIARATSMGYLPNWVLA